MNDNVVNLVFKSFSQGSGLSNAVRDTANLQKSLNMCGVAASMLGRSFGTVGRLAGSAFAQLLHGNIFAVAAQGVNLLFEKLAENAKKSADALEKLREKNEKTIAEIAKRTDGAIAAIDKENSARRKSIDLAERQLKAELELKKARAALSGDADGETNASIQLAGLDSAMKRERLIDNLASANNRVRAAKKGEDAAFEEQVKAKLALENARKAYEEAQLREARAEEKRRAAMTAIGPSGQIGSVTSSPVDPKNFKPKAEFDALQAAEDRYYKATNEAKERSKRVEAEWRKAEAAQKELDVLELEEEADLAKSNANHKAEAEKKFAEFEQKQKDEAARFKSEHEKKAKAEAEAEAEREKTEREKAERDAKREGLKIRATETSAKSELLAAALDGQIDLYRQKAAKWAERAETVRDQSFADFSDDEAASDKRSRISASRRANRLRSVNREIANLESARRTSIGGSLDARNADRLRKLGEYRDYLSNSNPYETEAEKLETEKRNLLRETKKKIEAIEEKLSSLGL